MQTSLKQYSISHGNTQLILLPCKLVWWPDQKTLFMADSHFGKASTFRQAGLAVPKGTTSKMLGILSSQVLAMAAQTLIVLGDLLHSSVSAVDDFEYELTEWRRQHSALRIILIKGNHDKKDQSFYDRLQIETKRGLTVWEPFELCHEPSKCSGQRFALCGHIHPAVRVANSQLKCFWLRVNQLVLPAFGEFTGTARITLAAGESAIAICEDRLFELSDRMSSP